MSIAKDTFRNLASLAAYAVKTFFFSGIVTAVVYGVILAFVAFQIAAADGSMWRGGFAAVLSLIATTAFSVFVAMQLAIAHTLRRAIQQAAVGSRVFNALFDTMLGVNDDNPSGSSEWTQSLHGISREEFQQRLTAAAEGYLRHERIEAALPRLGRWLLRNVQRTLVWTVVKVIMLQAKLVSDGPTIDLLEVRGNLAGVIDNRLAEYFRAHTRRTLWSIGAAILVVVVLLSWGVRHMPVGWRAAEAAPAVIMPSRIDTGC